MKAGRSNAYVVYSKPKPNGTQDERTYPPLDKERLKARRLVEKRFLGIDSDGLFVEPLSPDDVREVLEALQLDDSDFRPETLQVLRDKRLLIADLQFRGRDV